MRVCRTQKSVRQHCSQDDSVMRMTAAKRNALASKALQEAEKLKPTFSFSKFPHSLGRQLQQNTSVAKICAETGEVRVDESVRRSFRGGGGGSFRLARVCKQGEGVNDDGVQIGRIGGRRRHGGKITNQSELPLSASNAQRGL